jgi:hypothetical protein
VPFAHDTPEAPTPELPLSGAYSRGIENAKLGPNCPRYFS